jgi:hypothetical protein
LTPDPIGQSGGLNLFAYVENNPVNWIDQEGLSGSKPGGPYHPPDDVHFSCKGTDSCDMIKAKIWILERMLYSHIGWDLIMPAPRGGGRHAQEISDLFGALAKCKKFKESNCTDCDCFKLPKSSTSPGTGTLPGPVTGPTFVIP